MRNEALLKIVCGLVLALVIYRLALAIVHVNPLYHVTIPALPALASATTNSAASKMPTNAVATGTKNSTNAASKAATAAKTNAINSTNVVVASTNVADLTRTNLANTTNGPSGKTNQVVLGTNSMALATNSLAQNSNALPIQAGRKPGSNAEPMQTAGPNLPPGMPPGMPPGAFPGHFPGMPHGGMPGMPGMPGAGPVLPPPVQARIDRVIDSEILAPVMRPMPMALLGIAGKDVFFRAPNGQTGLIKEGEELGGVKLIRVGLNRVLVEEQGQQKELTIFAGLGSE